jgi:hypothetical protein
MLCNLEVSFQNIVFTKDSNFKYNIFYCAMFNNKHNVDTILIFSNHSTLALQAMIEKINIVCIDKIFVIIADQVIDRELK